MKIDILCNQEPNGSFIGVTSKTVWGDSQRIGVGGAELAIITMAEEWTKAGHDVVLYNSPWEESASLFEQRPVPSFDPNEDRDVLINFRSPNIKSIPSKGLKVWFSTDQYSVGDYAKFSEYMDKIVCISPFHAQYFVERYKITDTIVIDLPVRTYDFDFSIQKVKNRVIFTSVPDRGLHNLWRMWAKIKHAVPDASLVITSDYRLWGSGANNESYRVQWMVHKDYEFLGAVNRARYLEELMKAELFLYPGNYDELFCISVAEAQFAGAYPVTSTIGALRTTNMACQIDVDASDQRNDQAFIDNAINLLRDSDLGMYSAKISDMARERFSPEKILKQWDEKVFK